MSMKYFSVTVVLLDDERNDMAPRLDFFGVFSLLIGILYWHTG